MDDPDGDLVRRVGLGEARAAETLVRAKLPRMTALARRLTGNPADADEVVGELFLRVWREAPRWRPGQARFDTWMHRVATNLCFDRLRRRREQPLPDGWDAADPDTPMRALEAAEAAAQVEAALAALPPRQRAAIVLTYYQELSNRDAADLLGVGVDALESLLARGRRALRQKLTDAGGEG